MLLYLAHIHWAVRCFGFLLMLLDLYCYFYTLLGDPGIPQDIWDSYFGEIINVETHADAEMASSRVSSEPVNQNFHKGDQGVVSAFAYNRP